MSTMTQHSLEKLLTDRGWRILANRHDVEDPWRESRGISIQAISPNNYVLSIQAGEGLYSTPRRFADSYTAIEFAIWEAFDEDGTRHGNFITDPKINNGDSVVGWADLDHLRKAILVIEAWSAENRPEQLIVFRREAPHRDIN